MNMAPAELQQKLQDPIQHEAGHSLVWFRCWMTFLGESTTLMVLASGLRLLFPHQAGLLPTCLQVVISADDLRAALPADRDVSTLFNKSGLCLRAGLKWICYLCAGALVKPVGELQKHIVPLDLDQCQQTFEACHMISYCVLPLRHIWCLTGSEGIHDPFFWEGDGFKEAVRPAVLKISLHTNCLYGVCMEP